MAIRNTEAALSGGFDAPSWGVITVTMLETVTQAEYDNEVEQQAEHLVDAVREAVEDGEFDDPVQATYDRCRDVLDGHDWFARESPALHGCILEHSDADPSQYGDWEQYAQADTPEWAVHHIAYLVFETDVINTALDQQGH